MIEMPDPSKAWEYENGFYLTCDASRLSKCLAHFELFKMVSGLAGHFIECGVFKGASLSRFALMRELFSTPHARRIVGFDIYGAFPETGFEGDKAKRQGFIDSAGEQSISVDQMRQSLVDRGLMQNVDLVAGDITKTVPEYVAAHPELRIAMINLDTDIFEPAQVILEYLYPRLVPGGVLIVDDYGVFPGETEAVDRFFADQPVKIQKFDYAQSPSFIVKPS